MNRWRRKSRNNLVGRCVTSFPQVEMAFSKFDSSGDDKLDYRCCVKIDLNTFIFIMDNWGSFSQTNKCKICKRRKQIRKQRTKGLISESFVRWSTRRQRRTQQQLTNDFESGAFFLVQYFYNIVNCICLDQLSVFLTSARCSTWKLRKTAPWLNF